MPLWIRVVIFTGAVWVLLVIALAFMIVPASVMKGGPPIIE